jgi:radical SAM superfamily enzyme YgiQ (UPF0313 family)
MFRQPYQGYRADFREDGTGHFYKEIIPKPSVLKTVKRRFGRYGLPMPLVMEHIRGISTPDIIFVTSGMTYWYPGVIEMISLLKDTFKNIPVILGGIYATLNTDHALEFSGADRVVTGAGEIQGLQIADEITGNRSNILSNPKFVDLQAPLYDLYPRLKSAAILTSRGCPYDCPFCASSILSNGFQKRTPDSVVNEIDTLYQRYGVIEFAFYDDALLFDQDNHLIPILQRLIERQLPIHFHTPNGVQPREVGRNLARMMKEAGFKTIRLSYETKDRERQMRMGLKVRDEDLVRASTYLKEAGFSGNELGAYVIMGLPGQEVGEVVESMLFVLKQGIRVSLASFSPIPGTRTWKEAQKMGIVDLKMDPLLSSNSLFPVMSGTIPIEQYTALGTLSSIANGILSHGGNPCDHPLFLSQLGRVMNHG